MRRRDLRADDITRLFREADTDDQFIFSGETISRGEGILPALLDPRIEPNVHIMFYHSNIRVYSNTLLGRLCHKLGIMPLAEGMWHVRHESTYPKDKHTHSLHLATPSPELQQVYVAARNAIDTLEP